MANPVSGDALTALVDKWRERSSACQTRVYNRQAWEACGIEIRKCAEELAAVINAQLDTDIAHDWEVFEAGRQHGLAHGPSLPPSAVWTGLMAGFTPAATDRTTTNSGDTGGPSLDNPKKGSV